jgi:DNA polymerase III epsilon subunit-like protein
MQNHLHKYFEIQTPKNRVVVAHNESFDRNVTKSMALYGLDYADLNIHPVGNVP